MFRTILRPSMKRLSRRPVSDEQKAQAQAQAQIRTQHQNQNQDQDAVEIYLSVATISSLTQSQLQAQPHLRPDSPPQDQQADSEQNKEEAPGAIETGAQGDNEQSDNEVGPASSTTPIDASRGQPDGGNPAQLKALAGRQQIARLLTRFGDCAEGVGEANQIIMELLGSSDGASVPLPPPSAIERVSEQLLRVLREQTLIDAGIVTGNERYRCFKSVLQNYAKIYAARRFMEQMPQLGQLGRDADVEQELFARVVAEELLQIPELLRQLWVSLEKMEFFNEDTAFKAYLEARRHPHARILCELMLTRISRVFLCIVCSTFFLEFTEHELRHILRNCYLSVNSEIEIFLSVVLWLEHNWFERGNCAERILSEVRFALMPTWYLCTLERANCCRHFARVIHTPGVQRMIEQGREEAVTLKRKPRPCSVAGGPTTGQQRQLDQPQKEARLARDWIADTECRYHHKRHCERFVYPTYDAFKEYLSRIICCAPNYWRTFRPAKEVYRSDFRCCLLPHFN
ncbi:uncharacterized protein LOC108097359 isoform X2 [Drosophila ficusphila]|nr:uncharacterized protein LOC108097359 isoform X2 [Drosophila ficusphila]